MGSSRLIKLIERIRSGQDVRAAQEDLFLMIRTSLLERLGQIPPAARGRVDPEDILHTAFVRAIAAIHNFQPTSERSFHDWVFTVAKNVIADLLRRRSVRVRRLATEDGERGPRASSIPQKGARFTTVFRRKDWIESMLSRLAPREAEVIRLRHFQRLSYQEIAKLWKSTPGAVQRFHSRAFEKLRRLLQADGNSDPANGDV
jgi:RNA polymerase sigma-70 factor (ECF subfamily)